MAVEFDPAIFLKLPGTGPRTGGAAYTTRSTIRPCPCCGSDSFVVVVADDGRISCQCPKCCKRRGVVVGTVCMRTGATRDLTTDRGADDA